MLGRNSYFPNHNDVFLGDTLSIFPKRHQMGLYCLFRADQSFLYRLCLGKTPRQRGYFGPVPTLFSLVHHHRIVLFSLSHKFYLKNLSNASSERPAFFIIFFNNPILISSTALNVTTIPFDILILT